jgi:GNAT superfamily N-acetyltransferase
MQRLAVNNMLIIRQYQPIDKGSVRELHIQALEPTGAMLPGGPWNDDDLSDISNQYLTNGGEFLVGILDNRIVCMGALKKKSDTAGEIKRMRVLPDFQRKGYGQLMLDRLEARARQFGYAIMFGYDYETDSRSEFIQKERLLRNKPHGFRRVRNNIFREAIGIDFCFNRTLHCT